MAKGSITTDEVEEAVYYALYPREGQKYSWQAMKEFADKSNVDTTYSRNIVRRVTKYSADIVRRVNDVSDRRPPSTETRNQS